jgi:hypothetical protein
MKNFDEQTMRGLFLLADIKVLQAWPLVNQYDADRKDPWWLVKTPAGLIKLGWRKRVISIDWSDTAIREVITDHEVTKDETMVHAWSVAKAVEYLEQLGFLFKSNQSESDGNGAPKVAGE